MMDQGGGIHWQIRPWTTDGGMKVLQCLVLGLKIFFIKKSWKQASKSFLPPPS